MDKSVKQNGDSGLVTGMPVQRGKIISAIVLISIMGILWLRVFLNSKDKQASANAKSSNKTTQNVEQEEKSKLEYVDLPVIEGRALNDLNL